MKMVEKGERPPRPEGIDFSPKIPFDDLWSLVEACWAQFPDQRPTGGEVLISILKFQKGHASDLAESIGQSSAIAETGVATRKKHACQDCDKAFSNVSLLNDHIKVYHMNICERLTIAVLHSN
jgi:hypothetical protein